MFSRTWVFLIQLLLAKVPAHNNMALTTPHYRLQLEQNVGSDTIATCRIWYFVYLVEEKEQLVVVHRNHAMWTVFRKSLVVPLLCD